MKLTYKSPKLEKKRLQRAFLHPELKQYLREDWREIFALQIPVFLFFLIFFQRYPYSFISFDLMLSILVLLLYAVCLPLMVNGKLKGFYRRSYSASTLLYLMKFIIHGTWVRTAFVALYYALILAITKDDTKVFDRYINTIKEEILWNPVPQLIAVLVFAFFVYYMFYREQYIEIPQYEIRIRALQKTNGWGFRQATHYFLYIRDEELEKGLEQRVEYKWKVKSNQDMVKDNSQNQEAKVEQVESFVCVKEPVDTTIRRKSRRK